MIRRALILALALACLTAQQASAVSATGGTVTNYTIGGTNWTAHIFKTVGSNTFTVTSPGNVEYLVVAGGGNGGSGDYSSGGGGGAGGYQSNVGQSGLPVTMQTYTVVVANAEQDSKLYGTDVNLISKAGGRGGTGIDTGGYPNPAQVGGNGGSGGGGGGQAGAGGVTNVYGQGNNGGRGINGGTYNYGGGGGGASQVGGPGVVNVTGGPGGNGIANAITGIASNYCGGGGGGPNGPGGIGGGGAGTTTTGNPGGANTGGGGGGGATGGAGGSGIVVVRYVTGGGAAAAAPARYFYRPNLTMRPNRAIKNQESAQ